MDEVDAILRDGGNLDDHYLTVLPSESRSALRIAARFAKGLEGNADFLRDEYLLGRHGHSFAESGKGFSFGNRNVCAWYTAEGVELAIGTTAHNNLHRVLIPWEDAAARIDELMREGRYVSNAAYELALEYERIGLADELWTFYRDDMHDMPKEWKSEHGGHPEDIELIKSLLADADKRQAIHDRLEADVTEWRNDPERRSYHNPARTLANMKAAMRPPVIPPGGGSVPEKKFSYFFTQDEIDALLTRGGSYHEGKLRFLSFLLGDHDEKEKLDFFKWEYGHGGGTWGYTNGWYNAEPGKGVTLQRGNLSKPDVEITMKWPAVVRRTEQLVREGRYATRAELDYIPRYEKLMLIRSVNNFYANLPDDYERPFPGTTDYSHNAFRDEDGNRTLDFTYPHEAEWQAIDDFLGDAGRVDRVLAQMEKVFVNTPEEDRFYDARRAGFTNLDAYRQGTFSLFPGLENLPDPETARARRIAPPASPRRELVEDLRDSPFGAFPDEIPQKVEQISLFDLGAFPKLPGVEEQRARIGQTLRQEAAESESPHDLSRGVSIQAASALERDGVDAVLLDITISEKSAIAEQFADNPRSRDAVNLVKEIYGDALTIPVSQAVKRITELLAEGAFATADPYTLFEQVRDEMSERGYSLSGEVIEDAINTYNSRNGKGGVLDVADFIEDIMENPGFVEEATVSEPQAQAALTLYRAGDFYEFRGLAAETVAAFLEADTVWRGGESVYGFPAHRLAEIGQRLAEAGYTVSLFEEPKRPYQAGDTVWLDNREFRIESIGGQYKVSDDLDRRFGAYGRSITLIDVLLARTYPITRSMYQAEFESALSRDERNAHLVPLGEPEPEMPSHMDSEDTLTETEMEVFFNEPAEPVELDFDAVAQTVLARVMADADYAKALADAPNRASLRNPCGWALEQSIGDHERDEPEVFRRYLVDEDFNDRLFTYVHHQSWANRPVPEAVTEQPDTAIADKPLYQVGDTFYREDGKPYIVKWIGVNEISYYSPDTPYISALMKIPAFEALLRENHQPIPVTPLPDGFHEITDPAEVAEIEEIFGGQEQTKPIAVIDNVSRNNFNLFALTFPRLIDGTYQSMTFKDANNRELSVSYANTDADIITLDVSYTKHDGHTAFAPMIQFYVNHEQRMLTVNGYADDDRNEDAGFLRLADGDQLSELNVRAFGYLCNIRNIGFDLKNPAEAEVFLDAEGNPLPAEPKADIAAFLKERVDRESDAHGRVQASMFAPVPEPERKPAATQKPVNFRITDDHLGEGGAKLKFRGNLEAIRTLHDIEFDKRSATPQEQEILSRYVGWGGLPQAFDADNKQWENEYLELSAALSPEEYALARASTLNAHYTSPLVIKAIYETVERMGFKAGNILEPSCGVGNFFGLLPDSMAKSKLYGVELDSVTARIAKQLYPQANIKEMGFEKTDMPDSFFDLAVGNVPFGQYNVPDKRYDKHKFSIHDYFFAKSLDQVRPGGVIAFVTSKYTMDKQNPEVRKYIAQRAELLGAVRLPNDAFLKNAGTETTMDILFLQKRDRPMDIEPDWVHLGLTEDNLPVNRYFLDNPEMLLGTMALDKHMNDKYGRNDVTACLPIEG
ncbi:MAG: N-6 DNA methylase, partial [Oscillospiraceae bacterium]|nr:N-6 DNA methylase [Oscillospiraceae bacterium]